ncbi:hypothetical protein QUA90_11895 [Microcoleus sp. D3_18_C4]
MMATTELLKHWLAMTSSMVVQAMTSWMLVQESIASSVALALTCCLAAKMRKLKPPATR